MIINIIKPIFRWFALNKGMYVGIYRRICAPTSSEYACYLRKWGGLNRIGEETFISPGTNITDPAYVRIGNNCTLADCTLLGHDGVIRVLNNAYGKKLDSVGKIEILDNCFIGYSSIIMPGVTIGPNSIIAAGSVVTKNVPQGQIFGGVPARKIGNTQDLVEKLEKITGMYPWNALIQIRDGAYDPNIEPQLIEKRIEYFFGKEESLGVKK